MNLEGGVPCVDQFFSSTLILLFDSPFAVIRSAPLISGKIFKFKENCFLRKASLRAKPLVALRLIVKI